MRPSVAILFQAYVLPLLEKVYRIFVRFALTGFLPIVFFIATILIMIGSINLLTNSGLKIDLFPANEPSTVFVFIEQPIGTDIGKTNAFNH